MGQIKKRIDCRQHRRHRSPSTATGQTANLTPSPQGTDGYGMGFWWMIIHDVPNLSLNMLKRKAKKVSSIGM
jgi:hypothetical protein